MPPCVLPKLGDLAFTTDPITDGPNQDFDVYCDGFFIGYIDLDGAVTQNWADIFNCMVPAIACSGCVSKDDTRSNQEFREAFQALQRSCCQDVGGVVSDDEVGTSGGISLDCDF